MRLVRERKAHVYERTRPNGTIVEVSGMPIEGGGFVTTYLDVTEQRRNQALIAHMAHHDTLTDLPNRVLFTDRLHTAIALAKRSGLMAVHCLDIDKFKPVNDTFGHQAGDALLIAPPTGCARRCAKTIRWRAWAATNSRSFRPAFAKRPTLRCWRAASHLFSSPFEIADTTLQVSLSIGIALAPVDG